jgi:hypothetical protein
VENLLLWIGSTLLYFVVFVTYMIRKRPTKLPYPRWVWSMKRLGIIALLTLPVNFDGHVVTVFGNAVGEKSVWSVASLYQKGGDVTVSVMALYQKAERLTFAFVAPLTYQESGRDALNVVGVPSVQNAGERAILGFGIAGIQKARDAAQAIIGLAIYQQAGEKERWFGACFELKAAEEKK